MLRELAGSANTDERDRLIASAIEDRRILSSERAHYTARFDRDPDGTRKLLSRLARGPALRAGQTPPPAGTGLLAELSA
jgi:hypothetical protein